MKLKPSSHMLTYRPAPPAFTVPILYRYSTVLPILYGYTFLYCTFATHISNPGNQGTTAQSCHASMASIEACMLRTCSWGAAVPVPMFCHSVICRAGTRSVSCSPCEIGLARVKTKRYTPRS